MVVTYRDRQTDTIPFLYQYLSSAPSRAMEWTEIK